MVKFYIQHVTMVILVTMMWTREVAQANGTEGDDGVVQTVKVRPAALYVIEHERGQHNEEPSPCHQDEEGISQESPA